MKFADVLATSAYAAGADLKDFALLHGGLSTAEGQDYSQAQAKLLIMHGSADSNINLQDFAAQIALRLSTSHE